MAVCCVCNKANSTQLDSLIQCAKCKLFVHKECYGIPSQLSTQEGWLCQRCGLGSGNERCHLCPFSDGALKKTDSAGWAHILCAQYIPEVIFGNNYSMEPINLAEVPGPRFQQVCYICDEQGNDLAKRQGACMQCNVQNCINCFHVTCGQKAALLVAEDCENRRIVDYYGFCSVHVKHKSIKPIPKILKSDKMPQLDPTLKSDSLTPPPSHLKLPTVDTLSSTQLKDISKILPNISSAPKNLPLDSGSNFKPIQPKVQAEPLPFQGVHKQDSIIDTGMQHVEGDRYPAKKEEHGSKAVSAAASVLTSTITSTTASAATSANSTPLHRKPSSETDTADSEDLGAEPIVKALQSINYSSGNKTQLSICKQGAPDKDGSDGNEQYNDLMDLFTKKPKKKKYKSPDSEMSDYVPYNERKRNSLHKKGRRGKIKKDPLRIRSLKSKISKSPKYSSNSYLYTSPPKTPIKVQKSNMLSGEKGYSPSQVVTKMIEETKELSVEDYKPCTGKPIISLDTFFDRFKEMGMQHILNSCKSERSRELLNQIQEINHVNSYLSNRIKTKSAKLEQLKSLNRRLSIPYTKPISTLPDPVPLSRAVTKLLSTVHRPPEPRNDAILAETWLDKESSETVAAKSPLQPTCSPDLFPEPMSALVIPTKISEAKEEGEASGDVPETPSTEIPQIIIAGDPPMAYTYKDGAVVGYDPEQLQTSLHYNKVLEEQYSKVVEQHYKEKISAAYFEAQRRQYEGLLQHQMQSKMQASDYLTQAYLSDPFAASYYYAQQQATGRQMPSLTAHFPPTPAIPQQSYSGIQNRPPVSRS